MDQTDVRSTLPPSGTVDTCTLSGIEDGHGMIHNPLLQGLSPAVAGLVVIPEGGMGIPIPSHEKRSHRDSYVIKAWGTLSAEAVWGPVDIHQGEPTTVAQLYFYSQDL